MCHYTDRRPQKMSQLEGFAPKSPAATLYPFSGLTFLLRLDDTVTMLQWCCDSALVVEHS